jgi:hypothetical protein
MMRTRERLSRNTKQLFRDKVGEYVKSKNYSENEKKKLMFECQLLENSEVEVREIDTEQYKSLLRKRNNWRLAIRYKDIMNANTWNVLKIKLVTILKTYHLTPQILIETYNLNSILHRMLRKEYPVFIFLNPRCFRSPEQFVGYQLIKIFRKIEDIEDVLLNDFNTLPLETDVPEVLFQLQEDYLLGNIGNIRSFKIIDNIVKIDSDKNNVSSEIYGRYGDISNEFCKFFYLRDYTRINVN